MSDPSGEDVELDQILADEIEAKLQLLQADPAPGEMDVRAALHSLRGATAMAGHIELSVLLAQCSVRLRRGAPEVVPFLVELLGRAAARLRDGQPPLTTRWPQPPDGLMALPLDEEVSTEYVRSMGERLLRLDEALARRDGFVEAYRVVHGMKSAAAAVGDDAVAWFCHGLESALHDAPGDAPEGGPLPGTRGAAADFRARLARHRDSLALLIEDPACGLESLRGRASNAPTATSRHSTGLRPSVLPSGEVRVSTAVIDRALDGLTIIDRSEEDLRSAAELAQHRVARLRDLRLRLLDVPRVAGDASERELTALAEELTRTLDAFVLSSARSWGGLRRTAAQLRSATRELRQELVALRVTDAAWLFSRARRGIAEQALLENKLVEIVTQGDEVPLDRPLADRLLGALGQLLRNAVAHGIEPASVRRSLGKPVEGRIELRASRTASTLRIEVDDDGRGVDLEALRRTARALGMDPSEAVHASPEHELLTLLALPGVTTRGGADLLAGRGMGLHIAQETVLALGGSLTLRSRPEQGFSAWLELPLEGAFHEVCWLEAGGRRFALPFHAVGRVRAPGEGPPVTTLAELLGLAPGRDTMALVELHLEGLPALFGVERFGDVERVVVHPVPEVVRRVGPFAGAVRGVGGSLSLVLDARVLVARLGRPGAERAAEPGAAG